jgi:toxin-antitoxin system PIN domain toxin
LILPDVNVLIYAFRSDSDRHDEYKGWLEDAVNGSAAYGMSPQVLASFLRICTHPRIFLRPSALDTALRFCRALLERPNATVITPQERHWDIFERLCRDAKATGNVLQDAWFAALAIETGCEWITMDRDFARFEGLNWRTPF